MPLLIMPFMSGGNVLKYVRQNKETLYLGQDTANVTQVRIIYLLGVCYQQSVLEALFMLPVLEYDLCNTTASVL